MNCPHCGNQNELEAKFCVHCGGKIDASSAQAAAAQEVQAAVPPQISQNPAASSGENPVVKHAKQYVDYIKQHIKLPSKRSESVNQNEKINGIITLSLFAIILPLLLYIPLAKSGLTDWIDDAFFTLFLKPLFIVVLLLAILVGIIYGIAQLMKVKVHIFDVLARFGSYMVVPTGLTLIALLFSLIGAEKVTIFFLYFGLLSVGTAICFILYSYRSTQTNGLDPFYGVILTYLALGIVIYFIGDSLFGVINPMPSSSVDQNLEDLFQMFE
jgi:hypothetical protein